MTALADPTIRRQVMSSARRMVRAGNDVSVRAIAADAGVSRATLYRHFGSRRALLSAIHHAPPPDRRDRVLEAAAEMLVHASLGELSMDALAQAAGVSRATLYRLFPGKPALFAALIERYSPFEEIVALIASRGHEPPDAVLPALARAVVRVAMPRQGVVRALLLEATSGSPAGVAGVRPMLERGIGALSGYLVAQMDAGRLRRMHPFLALQAVMGPVAFHLLTRPVAERVIGLDVPADEAVDELMASVLAGLLTDR
jgi:AcrR family transcriptional regulator